MSEMSAYMLTNTTHSWNRLPQELVPNRSPPLFQPAPHVPVELPRTCVLRLSPPLEALVTAWWFNKVAAQLETAQAVVLQPLLAMETQLPKAMLLVRLIRLALQALGSPPGSMDDDKDPALQV